MTSPGKVEGPSALRARVLIPVTVVFVGIGAMFVWFGPKFLLQRWLPEGLTADDAQRSLLPATQSVLFVLGGLIAVVGVVVSLSRHRQEIAAAERDSARYDFDRLREDVRVREAELSRTAEAELGLRQRFVSAVDLLADRGSAIRRAAGLYAIASLADDWGTFGNRAEQQVCIDVLCGYLRSPQGNGQTAADEITVRQTGFEIIRAHLRSRGPNWAGCRFNLSGSRIDYVADLRNITVDPLGRLDFVGCRIEGDGQLLLQGLESTGVLNLRDVVLNVDLIQDSAPQPTLDLSRSRFDMAAVEMRGMKVLGRASVDFKKARIVGGTCMIGARLAELAEFNFRPSSVQQTHVRISVYMIDHSVVKLESTTYSEDAHLSLFGSAEDSAVLELGVGQATSRSATDENAALRLDNAHLRIGPFSFTDNSALDVRGIIVGLSSSFDSRRVSARAQAVLSLTGVAGSGEAFLPVPEN